MRIRKSETKDSVAGLNLTPFSFAYQPGIMVEFIFI